MSDMPFMKCGHTANSKTSSGRPYCVICNCDTVAEAKPDLTGRKAKCGWCGKETTSDFNLPFFEYKPNEEYDEYYCGCEGWV